ncbi:8999_t:CDS:2, partial [Ambispora gerdemannii]
QSTPEHSLSYPPVTDTSLRDQSSVYASPLPSPVDQRSIFSVQQHQEESFVENPFLMILESNFDLMNNSINNDFPADLANVHFTSLGTPTLNNSWLPFSQFHGHMNQAPPLTPTTPIGLSSPPNQLESSGILINNLTHQSTKQMQLQLMDDADSLQDSYLREVRLELNNATHVQHPISHVTQHHSLSLSIPSLLQQQQQQHNNNHIMTPPDQTESE